MSDKLRNLIVRTLSGAVLLAVVFAAAWYGMMSYRALLLVIGIVGLGEFYVLAKRRGAEPQYGMGLIAAVALMNGGYYLFEYIFDACGCSNVLVMLLAMLIIFIFFLFAIFVREVFRNRPTPIFNIATTVMGVVYVALPMTIMIVIPALLKGGAVWSPWYFLWYLFLVWGNDVFAYLTGVCFGKHKMCPRLSPGKSWEGTAGGYLFSLGAAAIVVACAHLLPNAAILEGVRELTASFGAGLWFFISIAILVTVGICGDLLESLFKRQCGVKDSSALFPAMGGFFDTFDSVIFIPATMLFLIALGKILL